jgi:hypothetical protein
MDMSRIYANEETREHLRQKLGDRGVEIFDYFKDHGFDYTGFYTGFIITRNFEYLKDPPHGYIIFPKGMRDPHVSGCFGYMYRVQWGVDLDGNEDFILYTSFAPQDEMVPKYLLGKLGDKELQLLVSERAKEMFAQWVKLRKKEMEQQHVRI